MTDPTTPFDRAGVAQRQQARLYHELRGMSYLDEAEADLTATLAEVHRLQQERDSLRLGIDATEHTRLADNAYLLKRAEQAEQQLATLRAALEDYARLAPLDLLRPRQIQRELLAIAGEAHYYRKAIGTDLCALCQRDLRDDCHLRVCKSCGDVIGPPGGKHNSGCPECRSRNPGPDTVRALTTPEDR